MYYIPPDTIVEEIAFGAGIQGFWHLPEEIWEPIWNIATGKDINIAIIDTGVAVHPDLPIPVKQVSYVSDEDFVDLNGHGTHVAGVALGRNSLGVAPGANLFSAKVLSRNRAGTPEMVATAIRWAVKEKADIINLSLGGSSSNSVLNAIDFAWRQGVIVNAAAGNAGYNGANTIDWPAKYHNCICTAAHKEDFSIASFSSGGEEIDWAAPGENIVSAHLSGHYVSVSGTSQATPFASGFLALILELMRKKNILRWHSKSEFDSFIEGKLEDRGPVGSDPYYGKGIPRYASILNSLL